MLVKCWLGNFTLVAHIKSESSTNLPPLWGWLALCEAEVFPTSWKRLQNQYSKSIAQFYGLSIDPLLRLHADWLCDIKKTEQRLEGEIAKLLRNECFQVYNAIFDAFGFGLRVRCRDDNALRTRLLSRIYPFEAFLSIEGKPLIEYEVKEVKKVEKQRRDGQNIIKRSLGDIKRVKRNRRTRCI